MPPAAPQKIIHDEYESDSQGTRVRIRMTGNPVDVAEIIHRLAFFDTFTADEKRQIASEDARFRMYNPGEMLIRQGSNDQSLFIILSGTVAVTGSAGGTVLAVLRAGDIFGEMAFLTDTRRTANVVARDAVIALKLDKLLFEQLSAEVREKFKDKIIKKLVTRLETANKELTRLIAMAGNGPFEIPETLVAPARLTSAEPEAPVFESGRELIRKIISQTASLPAMPEVMIKVQKLIQHPATSPAQLAKVIETDPSMVAGILKVANSAYYGFRGKVSTIQHASSLFGTRRLAELITAMSAGGVLGKAMDGYGHKAGDMWRHSILVACTASEIAAIVSDDILDSAYMAGLLHDIGKIILDPYVRERKMLFDHYFSKYPEKTIQEAEGHILGFDHAVIAAILCEKWSLPKTIAFGIRNHHQPSSAGDHLLSHIVHLADYLSGQTDKEKEGKFPAKVLDPATRSIISLDPDALDTIVKKARQYTKSLTGRLAKR
ncbi:HDOD domain-containing protein [uncultured Desulfosarcina sp.]|uniref:HDOD domain-containing protein n=1 Tax=uncultured Desulfosarcina sp. TaxID=218289 RepID=UPI0029C84B0D|nr:HDOD domain-containing protein [uncultured Desulfosarcina sp.]